MGRILAAWWVEQRDLCASLLAHPQIESASLRAVTGSQMRAMSNVLASQASQAASALYALGEYNTSRTDEMSP